MSDLDALPDEVLRQILALTQAKKKLDVREKATESFMTFANHVYENFIEGEHHRIIAEKLERVARGELKRLIINMPPRHSKSEFASFLMPAWFLGRNPKAQDHSGHAQHRAGCTFRPQGPRSDRRPAIQRDFP
jgi:hypothetical protein